MSHAVAQTSRQTPFAVDMEVTSASGRRQALGCWLRKYADRADRQLFVGTDSRQTNGSTKFTSVVVSYAPGHGGTYASHNYQTRRIEALGERLHLEAWNSIELGLLVSAAVPGSEITVHLDVNCNDRFRSSAWASGLMGMVMAQGFGVEVKPRAFTASSLADALVREY